MPERAALVTGGSSGIGLAIARMLGKDLGYGVVPEIQFIRPGDTM